MTLRLYDTAQRSIRDFVPINEGSVGIYVCGATVQGEPHIGHLRSAVVFDQLRRWLTYKGYDVTLVRNVTDIDDKILLNAQAAGNQWWAHAYLYEQQFSAAYDALGVLTPTYEPRATGHITEMIELIQRLIEAGHAYPALDNSGDVYFDARSWPDYGRLTRQQLDDMEPAVDSARSGKKDSRDFALWKGHKSGDPGTAAWPTPWGRGRPGWHLECSAMVTKYLGPHFDIHGGGLDLRFPHHENEQAQSQAAGDPFANYWMHSGLLTIHGEKMSKSLGNSLFASDLLQQTRPVALRYYLGGAHYRSSLEYGADSMAEANAAMSRLETFVARAVDRLQLADDEILRHSGVALPDEFAAAMDDDLSVPAALAVIHERVRAGNSAFDRNDEDGLRSALLEVVAMLDILGLSPVAAEWAGTEGSESNGMKAALDTLVAAQLTKRDEARAAKDFATADAIRDLLATAGIVIADTPHGAKYTVKGEN
ncbi:cysteine--tRNA ligase [Saxibacter everestensis]|uniref:Cysteine--tRNA ligase n=1 Tax=Saxibacter everestensis TaxID=2909229 RepID=A0ABY8QU74_9MICO|nr:cysteine--tRNA ligase [Brevibacteriaceae bacterium ZFBP1038]